MASEGRLYRSNTREKSSGRVQRMTLLRFNAIAVTATLLLALSSCSGEEPTPEPEEEGSASTTRAGLILPTTFVTEDQPAIFATTLLHGERVVFKVDTGAIQSILSEEVADELELRPVGDPRTSIGFGGCTSSSQRMRIGGWSWGEVEIGERTIEVQQIRDLGTLGSTPVVGLLGNDVLRDLGPVTFDFPSEEVIARDARPRGTPTNLSVAPADPGASLEFRAVINGRPVLMTPDTGASATGVNVEAAETAQLRELGSPEPLSGLYCEVTGTPSEIEDWRAGPVDLPESPATIYESEGPEGDEQGPRGVLGLNVLNQFESVTFDYGSELLFLRS